MARRKPGLNFIEKKKRFSPKLVKALALWLAGIAIAVFVAFSIVYCVGARTTVIGDSMMPTLQNGQEVLINRITYTFRNPKRGEVIVFVPKSKQNTHYYVKRVIGLPGETVQIINGEIFIDGELYADAHDYIDRMEDAGIAENPITLGKGEFFVLGDNRNNSEDSRSANIGVVTKAEIYGKAWFKLTYGKDKMQFVK